MMIVKLALRGLWARRRRLAGSVIAVGIGVAFLVGTLTLSDTIRSGINGYFANAYAGTAVVVRSATSATNGPEALRAPIPGTVPAGVRAVPGVADAQPVFAGMGEVVGRDGLPARAQGPQVAENWVADPALNPYSIVAGHVPRRSGEAVVDTGTATQDGLRVGATLTLLTPRPVRLTVVGLVSLGSSVASGEGSFTGLTAADARRLISATPTSVLVRAAPGASPGALRSRIAAVLPGGVQAVTGTELVTQSMSEVNSAFLSALRTFLVAFAVVAVGVAAFTIVNIFSITVAQRSSESGLLRAIGAARRQILLGVTTEGLAIGLLGAALGLAAGVGLAAGLKALFAAGGFSFGGAARGLTVTPATLVAGVVVGLLVTLAASLLPAIRASRTPPLAEMRERARPPGAVLGRAVGLIARVIPRRGAPGRLARGNAVRDPRRTVGAAAALIVGVALVSLFTVFAGSLGSSLTSGMTSTVRADLVIDAGASPTSGVDSHVVPAIATSSDVAAVAGAASVPVLIGGSPVTVSVVSPAALHGLLALQLDAGSLGSMGTDGIAVTRSAATARHVRVGSPLTVTASNGATRILVVRAIYATGGPIGDYLADPGTVAAVPAPAADSLVLIGLRPGTALAAGQAAVARIARAYDAPAVQTRAAYITSTESAANALLAVVYVILVLAVLTAVIGIANALSLQIFERTREIGLLRALGTVRPQVRAMIRWEAVIIGACGAVGGILVGTVLGAVVAQLIVHRIAVPMTTILIVLVAAVAAGALAATGPARRAARLPIMSALATY